QSCFRRDGVSCFAPDGYHLGLEGAESRVSCECGDGSNRGGVAVSVSQAPPRKASVAMRRRVLTPQPGVSTGIGYYLAGMEEVRLQVQTTVKAIPDDLI